MHFVNIDGSETESEFFGRFSLFCDIEPSRGCAKPAHVGVYAGMNERKKTNKKKHLLSAYQKPPPTDTHKFIYENVIFA